MTSTRETFQISPETAELYESKFVARLFGPWATYLVEEAGISPGHSVLDVGCGTGIVARTAADRLKGKGSVAGLDLNENMLAVARRLRPDIDWRQGDAAQLPFRDETFDAVLCQSVLMFVPDVMQVLSEMARVVTRAGVVAIQLWDSLDDQPAYSRFVAVTARHAGPDAVSLLGTYWSLGDADAFARLLLDAGLEPTAIRTREESATFDSIDELVRIEMDSTPLGERVSGAVYERILEDSRLALRSFVTATGEASIPMRGHLITARRR